eukprot:TRINITY_DN104121_c0_g1_i1.p1 TRINITY_DN104121_c0_g1~~TRINITY_DN104121_c0_g1_i1.p1  ORF type:complete len:148 (-),score=21.48 TRINITY_DN104121_c0_g1_i1:174-617(-)
MLFVMYWCVWAGLVLGVSFLDAVGKFYTPGIDRAAALNVGMHLFKNFMNFEAILGLLGLAVTMLNRTFSDCTATQVVLVCILIVERLLSIVLISRGKQVIALAKLKITGKPTGIQAACHLAYVILEASKIAFLLCCAYTRASAHIVW